MGYKTTIEHARHYIEAIWIKGRTVEDIREEPNELQSGIHDMR
jgi:hypothetical protein